MVEANDLYLSKEDLESIEVILAAVVKSTSCGIAIGGSLAQRALLPDFAQSMSKKPLADIDLILLGNSFAECPISPTIKNDFYVTHINVSYQSYYFGMIHKTSKKWVDLFPLPYPWKFIDVMIGNKSYPGSTIESQVLYLAHDLFSRIKDSRPVREKWIHKLHFLYNQPILNKQTIENEFKEHKGYFSDVVEANDRDVICKDSATYIQAALRIPKSQATSRKWEKIRSLLEYPLGSVPTPNGITVEPRIVAWRVLL